jgi:hypothetical protein
MTRRISLVAENGDIFSATLDHSLPHNFMRSDVANHVLDWKKGWEDDSKEIMVQHNGVVRHSKERMVFFKFKNCQLIMSIHFLSVEDLEVEIILGKPFLDYCKFMADESSNKTFISYCGDQTEVVSIDASEQDDLALEFGRL